MFKFTDAERAYLTEMRALTTDTKGNELLVGLSPEETEEAMGYYRDFLRRDYDGDRFLKLHDKHERARFAVLNGEHELEHDKPTRQ